MKMGLQGHPCSDVHVWQVDNPQTSVTFARRTSNMLSLKCWVDCGALDSNNQMDDVCRRGFLFPASGEGMSFHHGNVKVRKSEEAEDCYRWILWTCAGSTWRPKVSP